MNPEQLAGPRVLHSVRALSRRSVSETMFELIMRSLPIASKFFERRHRGRRVRWCAACLALIAFLPATAEASPAGSTAASAARRQAVLSTLSPRNELRALIQTGVLTGMDCPNFTAYKPQLERFYEAGGYALAWTRGEEITPQARALIRLLQQASLKGLNPDDYDGPRWNARLAELQSHQNSPSFDPVRFDLALTVCTMRYLADLHLGRVNPHHLNFGARTWPTDSGLAGMMRNSLLNASDVDAVVASVEPPYEGYRRAEKALAHYSKLALEGDGDPLPMVVRGVRPHHDYSRMDLLVSRLRQLGDLKGRDATAGKVYEGAAVAAVRRFQRRHGLKPDGILGRKTITELNKPIRVRMTQLALTMERYRWIPHRFPQPPIVVNIPEFRLRTMRRQPAPFLSMRVVVGKAYRTRTPVFAGEMRYVVFRPYWNVPMSIQRGELIPKIRRNRDYLAEKDYEVLDRQGEVVADGRVSDNVLAGLRSGTLTIRQRPGPQNALGLVKFVFPNAYNVYLHSTPSPELFAHARRDFSHGCIRVAQPVALAQWVLRNNPGWTVGRIKAAMLGDETVRVTLAKPIPVLILYTTAWVEPDGEVRFFNDIYGYDKTLERALAERCRNE